MAASWDEQLCCCYIDCMLYWELFCPFCPYGYQSRQFLTYISCSAADNLLLIDTFGCTLSIPGCQRLTWLLWFVFPSSCWHLRTRTTHSWARCNVVNFYCIPARIVTVTRQLDLSVYCLTITPYHHSATPFPSITQSGCTPNVLSAKLLPFPLMHN